MISISILYSCGSLNVRDLEASSRAASWHGDEYVKLDSGYIQGSKDKADSLSWKGIPYAAPPVDELRWKAPRLVESWDGIRPADKFSKPATQLQPLFNGVMGSEDCLYLNIWRPDSMDEDLPVYIWIHGGGNSIGSPALNDYHGHALASRSNAVFISISYRLGPLGWFRHPALMSGNRLDDSGNYGLLDIIFALKWVQRNIESFGGNPDNITVSGESAGANNTLALMLSPEARGLFHKAIVQSGYKSSASIAEAEQQAVDLSTYLINKKRLNTDELTQSEIKELLINCRPAELYSYFNAGGTGMINHLYHIEDGIVFPKEAYSGFESGDYANKVPAIIGSNKEESKIFMFFDSSIPWRSELYNLIAEIGSLGFKEGGVDSIAEGISSNDDAPPVFAYRFDWGSENSEGESALPGNWGRRLGAMHTLEIPFFLGTDSINGPLFTPLLFSRKNYDNRKLLSGAVMDYTSNFIHAGNPNIGVITAVNWPEWDEGSRYIIFNTEGEELGITIDDRVITVEQRLSELKEQLEPELYARLIEATDKK